MRDYCNDCGANFLKGHQCSCEKECKCYNNNDGRWSYSPYSNCDRHPRCPHEHSQKDFELGLWWFPTTIELGGIVKANGQIEFRVRCVGCGRMTTGIGNENFKRLISQGMSYTWTRGRYDRDDSRRCQVRGCGRTDIEFHHFAPRNTFADADDWPYLPLCRDHHRHWHRMMDGYRWNAKAPQLNTAHTTS